MAAGKQSHSGVGLGREGAPQQARHSGREWGGRLDSGAPVGFCWMGNHWIWVDQEGSCLVWAVLAGDRRVGGSSLVDLIGLVVGRLVALVLHLIGLVVGAEQGVAGLFPVSGIAAFVEEDFCVALKHRKTEAQKETQDSQQSES